MAIAIFVGFVGFVLGLSFYFGRKTQSASGYYAAGGSIHWAVNGIAFAGDYLSAASFLGICGMIATAGYDGFLYSVGYLAGWIVALFVVAEPMKRLGKYTFTDAVDSKFNSRGIKLMAAISTLVVSICYLIPQMVGAGVLVEPLLGLPHAAGVVLVGTVVIVIVASAGMTSTTYVQFLKGGMLLVFSTIVVVAVLHRGLSTQPDQGGAVPFRPLALIKATADGGAVDPSWQQYADFAAPMVEAGGVVAKVEQQDGAIVKAGAVLAQFDRTASVKKLPELQAQLSAAEALSGESAVDPAARARVEEAIARSQKDVDAARRDEETAKALADEGKRERSLKALGPIMQARIETLAKAQVEHEAVTQDLARATARAEVSRLQSELDTAQTEMRTMAITAPIAGLLMWSGPVAANSTVSAKKPLGLIVPVSDMKTVKDLTFVKLTKGAVQSWWVKREQGGVVTLEEAQWESQVAGSPKLVNGEPNAKLRQVGRLLAIAGDSSPDAKTGALGPFDFLAKMTDEGTRVEQWKSSKFKDAANADVTVHYAYTSAGEKLLRPGQKFKVQGTPLERLDFISLMLALFLGTAALPHILIRYYTVPSPAAARKSTIVAIAAIGFFYILTLYMGLGAMTNGVINPADNNMSAPLLARSFGLVLFAIISAIAFATVLGTVAGLIVAASGAVAHDLMDRYANVQMDENQKVRAGRIAAFVVGLLAIALGIIFKGQNVSFLVGLAFAVAASANLPSIIMLLFWKGTTAKGIAASIGVGMISSLVLIALSPSIFKQFGMDPELAPVPFDNPGIVSIPLSFVTLVLVSLVTKKRQLAIEPEPQKA